MHGRIVLLLGFYGLCFSQLTGNDDKYVQDFFSNKTPSPSPPKVEEECECVNYYQCNNDSTINTSGDTIIDIRAQDCDNVLESCCYPPSITRNPIIPTSRPRKGCGVRNPEGVGFRITGGTDGESQYSEFPWMVAILQKNLIDRNLDKYVCGGSLIHPQVVITAAHCVSDTSKPYVFRAGEWDTQTTNEMFPYQERGVKSIIIHPKYVSPAFGYDIAVVILESEYELAENVDVVCLPDQDYVTPNATVCYATGWGKDKFAKAGKYSVILKKIDLPIIERENCQKNLRNTRLGKYFLLHETFVCAGGEPNKDTCTGDGGSPLVCPMPGAPDRYQQVGMVAWGIGCGIVQVPGVYVHVSYFRNWIDEQLNLNSLDTTSY